MPKPIRLLLRNTRLHGHSEPGLADLAIESGHVLAAGPAGSLPAGEREADLDGCWLLPGLVNAHDALDLSTFPPAGQPPYANLYDWIAATSSAPPASALALPLADRLFLGALRNLMAGATAVVHHNPDHRSLQRDDFPVRVLGKYDFAHSPGVTPALYKVYRTTDRRIPWLVRAAAGTDARAAGEVEILASFNVLRQNTVIVHGTALRADDAQRLSDANVSIVWCPEVDARLFGAQPPIAALRAAGVKIGLGSGSPASGARDSLSTLAAAAATGLIPEAELIDLATRGSAEVARLPVGAFEAGSPADFIATRSLPDLLAGQRAALALVMAGGRAAFGERPLVEALSGAAHTLLMDGQPRALRGEWGRHAASLLRRCPGLLRLPWLETVELTSN